MQKNLFTLSLALFTSAAVKASKIKMASISDIHMFLDYDANNSNEAYCWPNSGDKKLTTPAYFG